MSKKFSTTTADHLEWNQSMNLIRNLYNDEEYKLSLIVAFGSFWGLRISDILKLKYAQVYNLDELTLVEQKTGFGAGRNHCHSPVKNTTKCIYRPYFFIG